MRQFGLFILSLALSIPAAGMDLLSTVAISGRSQSVAIDQNYAYCADQNGLWVVDVSDPSEPAAIGNWSSPGLSLAAVRHPSTNYVYICDGDQGLSVIDVSVPSSLVYVGQVADIQSANNAVLSGSHLFVTSGFAGLAILDLANPASPVKVGEYVPSSYVSALAADTDLVALAVAPGDIHLLDVSDPANPLLLSEISLVGTIQALSLEGSLLQVLTLELGVSLYDVTSPANPDPISSFVTGGFSISLESDAENPAYLYIADWFDGVGIWDVSDPARPERLASFMPAGLVEGMDQSAGLLYLAVGDQGLEVWDVTSATNPTFYGHEDPAGSSQDVAYAGGEGLLFEAAGDAGLRVWDANLSQTEPLAVVSTPVWANGVQIFFSWVYVTDASGSVLIYDRSSSPTLAFTVPLDEYPGDLTINNDRVVYVAQGDSGALGLKLEGLPAPQIFGYVPSQGFVQALDAANDLLLACEGFGGFELYDISDPENVQWLSQIAPDGGAWCAALSGSWAFVGLGQDGIAQYDLSNPTSPVLLGTVSNMGWVENLSANGDGILIASSGAEGLFALSTAQIPPALIDSFNTSGLARNAVFTESTVACADEMNLSLYTGFLSGISTKSLPSSVALLSAYPNPFNPSSRIQFGLTTPAQVRLSIYDLLGRCVVTLMDGRLQTGNHVFAWKPDQGVSSGAYLLSLQLNGVRTTMPIVYAK